MAGDTYSANFPTKNSLKAYGGGDDAFVTKLNPSGSAILFSTFLGGSGDDRASALRLDSAGNIYVVGSTSSTFDAPTSFSNDGTTLETSSGVLIVGGVESLSSTVGAGAR